MSQTKNFNLPDLGEGLPDATIVEWFVKEGDVIKLDEPLVSMETAKAVVEVPSPVSGKVLKLAGAAGDIVVTGHMLAQFEIDPNLPQRAEGQDTGHPTTNSVLQQGHGNSPGGNQDVWVGRSAIHRIANETQPRSLFVAHRTPSRPRYN